MPACKLSRLSPVPPKGYILTQDLGNGKQHVFKGWEAITLTKEIVEMRVGNKLPRATFLEAMEDLSIETCQRLGCDPAYCTAGNSVAPISYTPSRTGGCAGCGRKKK